MEYQSISFRRLKGGVWDATAQEYTIGDLVYSIEASSDLQIWKTAPDVQIIEEAVVETTPPSATVEIATYRIVDAFGSALIPERDYLRLRVTRLP